ncbi:MAG: MarR family transcriptional regulator [Methanobrevibacter sp.]|jgi:DNA-binding MarR family transcriptional regulator|nr:MarR family transcriptional regulator [Methanobrevibacter sp.]
MVFIFDEKDLIWSFFKLKFVLTKEIQKKLKDFDISPGQWIMLSYIYQDQGINQKVLAEKFQKDRAEISRLLNKLEEKQLISKKQNDKDKREFFVYLTPTGSDIYKKSAVKIEKLFNNLKNQYKKHDLKEFSHLVSKLNDFLETNDDL